MESLQELDVKKTKQLQVRYSKTGLANFYGDYIEINEKLKNDKALRDYIVKHELGHSKGFDLSYEVTDGLKLLKNPLIASRLMYFYLTHPSTWVDLLPVQIKNKQIVYDLNLTILYILGIGIIGSMFFFVF